MLHCPYLESKIHTPKPLHFVNHFKIINTWIMNIGKSCTCKCGLPTTRLGLGVDRSHELYLRLLCTIEVIILNHKYLKFKVFTFSKVATIKEGISHGNYTGNRNSKFPVMYMYMYVNTM